MSPTHVSIRPDRRHGVFATALALAAILATLAPGSDTLRAEPTDPEFDDATASGGLYFYFVRAVNIVGPSADSNHTAVFSYTLTPGAAGG